MSREGVCTLKPMGQIQPMSVLVDTVLLKHSHAHSLMYGQWLLSGSNDTVE